tara:strand:+ start:18767 stop:19372 length:606 start_codon:yes stop_codon:yes gene_type:complete
MLIGIAGRMGSGKNTVADMICKKYPQLEQKSFAYKLRKVVSVLTGIPLEDLLSQENKERFLPEFNMTIREILQIVGTEALRHSFHKDIWVLALFAEYTKESDWIITDVRFENEANAIKDRGGILLNIIREKNTVDIHLSETALDNYNGWDYTINNFWGLDTLEVNVKGLLLIREELDRSNENFRFTLEKHRINAALQNRNY